MNNKLVEYFKSIDGLKFRPGIDCNSIGFNVLDILYKNNFSKEVKNIINELNSCKDFISIREVIRKYGNFEKYLKLYNYKQVKGRVLPGDFLIKERKYINDVLYCVDAITFIGVGLRVPYDKSTNQVMIKRDTVITDKHKIWRKY
jgi:hypothetical protein